MYTSEIYLSLQGEGLFVGVPTVFVRTQGCSLRCSYCDSKYSTSFGESGAEDLKVSEVLDRIKAVGPDCKNVCLTGGEPLQQKHSELIPLVKRLLRDNYDVVVETGGHIATNVLLDPLREIKSLHICVDYKLPSSGMQGKMKWEAFSGLRGCDSIKFVVGDINDFDEAADFLVKVRNEGIEAVALFSPVWGSREWFQVLAKRVQQLPILIEPFRFSLQIHKVIWPVNQRGV